ncbi:MAG TPA: DUF5317 domain-containing protein [Actinomycetota bacterium]|nr:DUF5317 domain-containing protein [Actinomycetota bacterium]
MVRLLLLVFVGAIAIGLIAGGRFANLAEHRFRLGWLGVIGVVLQFVPVHGDAGNLVLTASFLCLFVVCGANWRLPGFVLILAGLLLNFVVITVNEGMPVSREAVVASGQAATLSELRELDSPKHHLERPDDRLTALGDVIPVGPPIRQVVSVGDIAVLLGVAWFLIAALRRGPDRSHAGRRGQPTDEQPEPVGPSPAGEGPPA